MSIPVVNLQQFYQAQSKNEFAASLGKAFEQIGFAAVEGHGIDEALIANVYKLTEQFFNLPLEVKKRYEIEGLAGQRGYTSFGKEHAKGFEAADLKEFFQFGQEAEGDDTLRANYPDNVKVDDVEGYFENLLDLFRGFERAGFALLKAIALYLNLDEDYFDEHVVNGNSILRAIYYPPITQEPNSAIRSEQHEDINLITLLVGASAEGLQIFTKNNEWQAVTAKPGQIVVNVGDMLQRLTNNKLRSTTHRVVNPPRELWNTARYSIPFFLHPKSKMSLACLESCINNENQKAYEDCTAGEYLDERLREIGLKA